MADQVIIDFVGNKDGFDRVRDEVRRDAQAEAKKPVEIPVQPKLLPGFTPGADRATLDALDKSLSSVQHKAADLHFNLNNLAKQAIGTAGMDGLGRAAERTGNRVAEIQAELKRLAALSGQTFDAKGLKSIENQTAALNAELDRVLNKVGRVAKGRVAADARQSAGVNFGKYGSAANQAANFLGPEAGMGLDLIEGLGAAGVGAGALTLAGGIALIGAKIVDETKRAREESERLLAVEQMISNVRADALKAQRDAVANYDQQIEKARLLQKVSDNKQFLTDNVEELKSQIATLTTLRNGASDLAQLKDSKGEATDEAKAAQLRADYYQAEIEARIQKINEIPKKAAAASAAASEATWENYKRNQEEAAKKLDEDLVKARARIAELSKEWKDTFTNFAQKATGDNPFVRQWLENTEALRKFNETADLLPPGLQKIGRALIQQANDLANYKLRLQSATEALDNRETARKFGGPTKEEIQADINERIAEVRRTSNSTNPQFAQQIAEELFKAGAIDRNEAIKRVVSSMQSTNPDAVRGVVARFKNMFTAEQEAQQKALDDRLNLGRGAKDPQERAAADAAAAGFAKTLNPNDLRADQRAELQRLFERQAERVERREAEALRTQQAMLTIWQGIDKNGIRLQQNVLDKGKQALEVTVQNKTGAPLTATTATPEDTEVYYGAGGHRSPFSMTGGTNL